MISRRLVFVTAILATAISSFTLGIMHSRVDGSAANASYDAKLEAIRSEMREQLAKPVAGDGVRAAGTSGRAPRAKDDDPAPRARMVAEIKEELQAKGYTSTCSTTRRGPTPRKT